MKINYSNRLITSIITCFSAFVLGYINAHGLLFYVGAMMSPQTGNIVNMAVRLRAGEIEAFITTLVIFGGFLIGCFCATGLLGKQMPAKRDFYIRWSIFFLPILANRALLGIVPLWLMIFSISFISGVGLCYFRKIGDIEVNNSIVTGNMRFMGNALFEMIFKGDKKKSVIFWTFSLVTFCFFLGAYVLAMVSHLGREHSFSIGVIIAGLPYIIGLFLAENTEKS